MNQTQQPGLLRKRTQVDAPNKKIEGFTPKIDEEAVSAAENVHPQSSQHHIQYQTNEDQRWLSSQHFSERPMTLHINKMVSSQDQSETNHVMMIGPTSSSRQVLFACASTGEIPQVMSNDDGDFVGVEGDENRQPQMAQFELEQHDQEIEQRQFEAANRIMAPPSVVINMGTPQMPQVSKLGNEHTPMDTHYIESTILHPGSSRKQVGLQKDINELMSVADNFSDAESKLTNRTSQNPSALLKTRLEPTMIRDSHLVSHSRTLSNATPAQIQQQIAAQRPFQGRTLLQKIQYAGQNQKTWQLDEHTGQILVKVDSADTQDKNRVTLYTQTQNQSSLLDSQTRKTIDSPHEQPYLRSQRYNNQITNNSQYNDVQPSGNFKQAVTLVAESLRKISSFRHTHGDCGSTLVKASGGSHSIGPASFTHLDSPSLNQKQFARNQPIITISGQQQPGEEYLKLTASGGSANYAQYSNLKLRQGIQAKRYQATPKRIQSANLNTQANKSRQPGRLPQPPVRANSMNQQSSKYLRQSQGVASRGTQVERSKKVASSSFKTQPLHALEPHNFTVDFDSDQASPKSSIRTGGRPRTTKSGRPTSSAINKPGNVLRQKSPPAAIAASLQEQANQTIEAVKGKKGNLVDSYNQHKMAEQLLHEEEQMAAEQERFSQALIEELTKAMQHDPELLLKRDYRGTSRVDEFSMEKLLSKTKYDSRQNILLAKNPLIIRKETFGNQSNFHLDTLKAIIEVLSKHSASDLSALAKQIPYQLMFPGQQELKEMELQGTNVGDITLQKDTSKRALFNFLGRLQDYQAEQQATYLSSTGPLKPTSSTAMGQLSQNSHAESKHKKSGPLNQGQITKRLLDQSKKRRMWSSRPSQGGPAPAVPNSRVTSAVSKTGTSSAVQRVEVTSDDYGYEKRNSRQPEAIDAYVYDSGVNGMKQVYVSGESHKSTFQGSALQNTELQIQHQQTQLRESQANNDKQLKMKLFPRDDSEFVQRKMLRQSEELQKIPDTCYKSKQAEIDAMRKSYEPVSSTKVEVKPIQIQFETNNKKKRQTSAHNSQTNMRGLAECKEQLRKPMVISEAPDSKPDLNYNAELNERMQVQDLLGKSHSFVTGVQHHINSSMTGQGFKMSKKQRCMSAIPANKKSRSNKHINVKSSDTKSNIQLEITGRPISRHESKRSMEANVSRRASPLKEFMVDESKEHQRRTPENILMVQTIVQGEPDTRIHHGEVDFRNMKGEADPRSPLSNIEDPTPHGHDYLIYQKRQSYDANVIHSGQQNMQNQPVEVFKPMLQPTDSQDFAEAVQRSQNRQFQQPSISTQHISPNKAQRTPNQNENNMQSTLKDHRRMSQTEQSSRRNLKALVEPINTDLVVCDENDSATISAKEKATTTDRARMLPTQQQSKLMQKFGKALQDYGTNTHEKMRASFPVSSVDIMRAYSPQQTKDADAQRQKERLKDDHFRGKRNTEVDPPSRNENPDADFHLSHNSTVKMEVVSSNNDGRSELPANLINKIISPQSQIGQVYHKTNLTIFQRSRPQAKSMRGDPQNGPKVALTNFNNHILFDPNQKSSTMRNSGLTKHNRVQSANFFRRHRNKSKQNKQVIAPCQSQQRYSSLHRQTPNVQHETYESICQDCRGVRGHHDPSCRNSIEFQEARSPTQFVISAIEHAGQNDTQRGVTGLYKDPSAKQTMFSPSEQQFVIEQLQELPIELTQQLAANSGPQQIGFASQTEEDQRYQSGLPIQTAPVPVKIVGHKNLSKHQKGLSLVSYTQKFLEGPRQKTAGLLTGKAGLVSRRTGGIKVPKRKSSNLRRQNNKSIPQGNFSPMLEVVNSQAKIMEQRRIKTNLDALIEQQLTGDIIQAESNMSPTGSIRLGITTMLGPSINHGARGGQADAATHTGNAPVKKSDLAHLNENSQNQLSDDVSYVKDVETNHGATHHRFHGNTDLTAIQQLSSAKNSSYNELLNDGGPHSTTNQYLTQLGSQQLGSQPNTIKQPQSSHEYVVPANDKDIMANGTLGHGTTEDSRSSLPQNIKGTRRNIISRQSSSMHKMSPSKDQRLVIMRHSSEDHMFPQSQKGIPVGGSAGSQMIQAPGISGSQALPRVMNQSLGSQKMNALDVESEKGMMAFSLANPQMRGSQRKSCPDNQEMIHPQDFSSHQHKSHAQISRP